jgi:DNA-binding transcriptional MerR regulator
MRSVRRSTRPVAIPGTTPAVPSAAAGWRAGELAGLLGISTDTLRHYERKGVLPEPRRLGNGYRRYTADALARVRTVRAALALGFTLDELATLLRDRERGRPPCREVRELAVAKVAAAEARLADLSRLVATLRAVLADWDARMAAAAPGDPALLLESLTAETGLDEPACRSGRLSPEIVRQARRRNPNHDDNPDP